MLLPFAIAIPLLFCAFCQLYQWRLLAAALTQKNRLWQAPRFVPLKPEHIIESHALADSRLPRMLVIVAAHNEELVLGSALQSIYALDYPRECMDVLVIADNCTDSTSEIAASCGAFLAKRTDTVRVGKGYALQDTIQALIGPSAVSVIALDSGVQGVAFDAVVFLDADTVVHRDMLNVFALRLRNGEEALQACYGVLNPYDSVRTRLMTCALALVHLVKPAGREALALSDGLKGNGMCMARRVLEAVQWSGDSITEDIEYTLRLCEAGIRIGFVPEALLWAQMPVGASASAGQRARWESGRYHLLLTRAPRLLASALRRRDARLLDRVIELIIPPFAELTALQALLLAISLTVFWRLDSHISLVFSVLWVVLLAMQSIYLLAGLWLARIPAPVAASLMYAPLYIVWKLGVIAISLLRRRSPAWLRTERNRT